MKSNTSLIAGLAGTLMISAGAWAQADAPVAVDGPGASGASGGPQTPSETSGVFDWKFRPTVGARYKMRVFQKLALRMTIPAMAEAKSKAVPLAISSIQHYVLDYDVLSRDALNATTVRLTYRTFSTSNTTLMNGRSMSGAQAQASNKMERAMSRAFKGAVLMMKVAPSGEIWSLSGLGGLRSRLVNELRGDPSQAAVMASVSQIIDDSAMKRLFKLSGAALPEHPISVNDKWSYKIDMPLNMGVFNQRLDMQASRQLAARRAGRAYINESGTFSLDMNSARAASTAPGTSASSAPAANFPKIKANLRGFLRGFTVAEESSGLPLESSISVNLDGQMALSIPAGPKRQPKSLSVPLSMTMQTRTTLSPVGEDASA